MNDRLFFPVGGTGGGPTLQTFPVELWRTIISKANLTKETVDIGLLTTPSQLATDISDVSNIIENHQSLEGDLNCTFTHLDEEKFANGEYDNQFKILCITCGNTFGALESWKSLGCDQSIKDWYKNGVIITGYSAGFIVFFEWASTDSVPGPNGARFGVMPCMGIISGGAIPHIDTQLERVSDFQSVLETQVIEPVIALGEDVMAMYVNEELKNVFSPKGDFLASWVYANRTIPIDIETVACDPKK